MSALRCSAAIWSCRILASASSRAFCSDTTLNFSTAPATSPTSSLRPRPGSTTEKLPPASFSIATVSARIGRAMVKTEKMQAPIRSSATSTPAINDVRSTDAASASAAARASRAPLLGKVRRSCWRALDFLVDRRQHLLADAVDLGDQLRQSALPLRRPSSLEGELLLADRLDLLLAFAEIADQQVRRSIRLRFSATATAWPSRPRISGPQSADR